MFWVRLGERFPKPEFAQVGITCGESEIRHCNAYSHLLQILNLNDDFASLLEVPAIQGRVNYLTRYLKEANSKNHRDYMLTLTLFSLFIENVSLFTQFVIIKSFYKHLNVLKDVDNVISATMKEEVVHALLGVYLVNSIKQENPEWFDDEFYKKIERASFKAFKAESEIIDWIFEDGELEFLSKDVLKEFLKHRFNESIRMIGGEDVYQVDEIKLRELSWFDEELYGEVKMDFFHQRPVNYTKKLQSVQAEDLF
jgi:ribonucleoside-diphosphate reductase beta chain